MTFYIIIIQLCKFCTQIETSCVEMDLSNPLIDFTQHQNLTKKDLPEEKCLDILGAEF